MVVELCSFKQGDEKVWDEYVLNSPYAGHFHLSGWKRVIERSYGHRGLYLWAHEKGKIKGILPIVLIRSILFGRSLVSLPFLDYGGICADNERVENELYQGALRLFEEHRVNFLDLRHSRESEIDLPSHGSKITFRLELEDNPERIWGGFNAKLRNQIRKAQRSDLTASWHGLEGLPDFYEALAVNMRDLGSPVHSKRFLAGVLEEFSNNARLILVRKETQTIGGGLCLFFKDTMLIPWASSLRQYFSLCPNNLLYWEAIRWGCEKGYRIFDFGRSSPGSGTYHFKKQWGAMERPLHWQCLSRNVKPVKMLQSDDSRYQWAIQVWRRLPLTITKWIGPLLRRQMSN